MKIAFNISPLQNENKNRGTGFYTASLLSAFKKIKNTNLEISEFTDKIPQDADLIHYPFFDPFFLTLPLIKTKPVIVTVHDLIPLKFPDRFPRGIKGEIKWQIQKMSLKKAAAVITDSLSSTRDIEKIAGISKEKIYSIPLSAGENYKPVKDRAKLRQIKIKYNLPDKFILYAGDVNWNKNIQGLIRAYAEIKKIPLLYSSNEVLSGGTSEKSKTSSSRFLTSNNKIDSADIKLVLVGKSFLNTALPELLDINKLIDQLDISDSILKLGFVPEEDLATIYNLAALYVQPSFYEGFGLPVLEAMACGCPVVCSNASSLPETAGEAVSYFNPYEKEEAVCKIAQLIDNEELRNKLKKKGLEQAKKFNWEKTAKETLKVYSSLVI